jgi:hypothetical protein
VERFGLFRDGNGSGAEVSCGNGRACLQCARLRTPSRIAAALAPIPWCASTLTREGTEWPAVARLGKVTHFGPIPPRLCPQHHLVHVRCRPPLPLHDARRLWRVRSRRG